MFRCLTLLVLGGLLTGSARSAGAADDLFAATGLSKDTDVMAAAEEATAAMMEQFRAAGRTPAAVIFLERVVGSGQFRNKGQDIGDRVKRAAGGVPTFGHGGVDVYGLTFGPDVRNEESTFLVLGLAGANLQVRGYATGGKIEYSYPSSQRPEDPERAAQWEREVAREKELRQAALTRGRQLGEQIPRLEKPGLILVLGALHNNWHVTFVEGIREALGQDVPIVGGVGKWDDYVYNDGTPLADASGKPATAGQLAVVIQGDMQVSLAGEVCPDKYKPEGVQATIGRVTEQSLAPLGGQTPDVVLAFSCVTLLRDSKIMDPSVLYAPLRQAYGEQASIFGCFCGGEIGQSGDEFSAGGDRLMVAVLADKPE